MMMRGGSVGWLAPKKKKKSAKSPSNDTEIPPIIPAPPHRVWVCTAILHSFGKGPFRGGG